MRLHGLVVLIMEDKADGGHIMASLQVDLALIEARRHLAQVLGFTLDQCLSVFPEGVGLDIMRIETIDFCVHIVGNTVRLAGGLC